MRDNSKETWEGRGGRKHLEVHQRKGQVGPQPEVARENQRMTNGFIGSQSIPDELLLYFFQHVF